MSDLIERLRNIDKPLVGGGGGSGNARRATALEAADALEAAQELAEAMGGALEAISGPDDVAFLDIKKCSTALTKFCSKMRESK